MAITANNSPTYIDLYTVTQELEKKVSLAVLIHSTMQVSDELTEALSNIEKVKKEVSDKIDEISEENFAPLQTKFSEIIKNQRPELQGPLIYPFEQFKVPKSSSIDAANTPVTVKEKLFEINKIALVVLKSINPENEEDGRCRCTII